MLYPYTLSRTHSMRTATHQGTTCRSGRPGPKCITSALFKLRSRFPKLGLPSGGPYLKDYTILGFMLGSPPCWKVRKRGHQTQWPFQISGEVPPTCAPHCRECLLLGGHGCVSCVKEASSIAPQRTVPVGSSRVQAMRQEYFRVWICDSCKQEPLHASHSSTFSAP